MATPYDEEGLIEDMAKSASVLIETFGKNYAWIMVQLHEKLIEEGVDVGQDGKSS